MDQPPIPRVIGEFGSVETRAAWNCGFIGWPMKRAPISVSAYQSQTRRDEIYGDEAAAAEIAQAVAGHNARLMEGDAGKKTAADRVMPENLMTALRLMAG